KTTLSLTGPYCGDGIKDASETCDDKNTDACGTCNNLCTKVQLAQATGSITVNTVNVGTKTLTINDGNNTIIFEFDTNGSVGGGRIPIDISSATTTTQVATAIVSAINSQTTFGITATSSGFVVSLTNKSFGTSGNRTLASSANASNLS